MAVLKIRDEDGKVQEILAIKGEKGEMLTEADKQEIVNDVLAALPVAEGVSV